MKIAYCKYAKNEDEPLHCCLCGEMDFDELFVHHLWQEDIAFCKKCWDGPNLGKRIAQRFEFEDGWFFEEEALAFVKIDDEV